jgi:hypothetical protein
MRPQTYPFDRLRRSIRNARDTLCIAYTSEPKLSDRHAPASGAHVMTLFGLILAATPH